MLKMSILIPVYNSEIYLEKCLDSVVSQTLKEIEIIIVNDGSTDSSLKTIEKYAKKCPKIKLINQANHGLSAVRNLGVSIAKGEYIIFVDSDDFIEKELCETIYSIAEKDKKPDIIKYAGKIFDENYNQIGEMPSIDCHNCRISDVANQFLDERFVEPVWLYAYKRLYFKKLNLKFPEGKVHEDFALVPLLLASCENFSATKYKGINYLIRPNSIMTDSKKTKAKVYDMLSHYDKHITFYNKSINNKETKKIFLNFSSFRLIYKAHELTLEEQEKFVSELKKRNIAKNLNVSNIKTLLRKIYVTFNLKGFINRIKNNEQ